MGTTSDTSEYGSPLRSRIFGNRIKRQHYYQQVHGPLDGLDENAEGLSFPCEDDDEDNDADDEMPVTYRKRTKKGTPGVPQAEERRTDEQNTIRQRMKEYLAANFESSSSDDNSSDDDTSATDGETLFVTQASANQSNLKSGSSVDNGETGRVLLFSNARRGPSTSMEDSAAGSLSSIHRSNGLPPQLKRTAATLSHVTPCSPKDDICLAKSFTASSQQETNDLYHHSDNRQAFDRPSKLDNLSSQRTRQQTSSLSFHGVTKSDNQKRPPPSSHSEPKTPDEVVQKKRRTSKRISAKPAFDYNVQSWFNDLLFEPQPATSGTKKRPTQKNKQVTPMPSTQKQRHSPVVLVSSHKPQPRKFIPETPPRDLQQETGRVYTMTKYDLMEHLPPALRSNQKVDLVKHGMAGQENLRMQPLFSRKRYAVDDSDPWRVPSSSESEGEEDSVKYKFIPTDESKPARNEYIQQTEASLHETSSSSTKGSATPVNTLPQCFEMEAIAHSPPAVPTAHTTPDIGDLSPPKQRLRNLLSQFPDASVAKILTKLDLAPESDAKSARLRLWYYLNRYSDEAAGRLGNHLQANVAKHALHARIGAGQKRKREDSMSPRDKNLDGILDHMDKHDSVAEAGRHDDVFDSGVIEQKTRQGRVGVSHTPGIGIKRQRLVR